MNCIGRSSPVAVMEDAPRRRPAVRDIFAYQHVRRINQVRKKIRDHTAPEIQIGPEIEKLLRVPFAPSGRSQKSSPIQSGGFGAPRIRSPAQVSRIAVPPRPCPQNFAQLWNQLLPRFDNLR